jgi:hypothetical protein
MSGEIDIDLIVYEIIMKCHNLYSSFNIRVIQSRGLWWAGHVVCMGEIKSAYRVSVGNHKG